MITRESVLTHAELVSKICNSRLLTSDMLDALQGLIEYAEQDPDPDAALWVEINELLVKFSRHNSSESLELVRARFPVSETRWLIVTRSGDAMDGWVPVGSSGWKPLSTIRDQLRTLATERGLLTPSLDEMQSLAKDLPDDSDCFLPADDVAKFKAFVAAQAAKGGG